MKEHKKISYTIHKDTGAKIPVFELDKNEDLTKHREVIKNRKGFSLSMLEERWNLNRKDVIDLLTKFKVPGHFNSENFQAFGSNFTPIDKAIFFEEYIYGIEQKIKLTHNKLKAKTVME